jgi:hypothetical protein
LDLDITLTNFKLPIPDDLAKKNLVIEISNTKNGLKQLKTYYSATLKVRLFENHGELKVFTTQVDEHNIGRKKEVALPKCYIKVYQKQKNGTVKFFKDGYTDLRGRFEYAILSGTSIQDVERFAILVQSEEYGSLTKEAVPPSGINKAF